MTNTSMMVSANLTLRHNAWEHVIRMPSSFPSRDPYKGYNILPPSDVHPAPVQLFLPESMTRDGTKRIVCLCMWRVMSLSGQALGIVKYK